MLQAELHRSVRWHKQQRLFLERSRRAFQWEQQGMKHWERLLTFKHAHKHTLNTASGADQFIHTKKDTKAEECRNVVFGVSTRASCLLIIQPKVNVFFPLILCHPVGLQPGPLTYIQLLTQAVIKVTSLHVSTTLPALSWLLARRAQWRNADGIQVCVCLCLKVWLWCYLLFVAYWQTLQPSCHQRQTLLKGGHQICLLEKMKDKRNNFFPQNVY